MIQLLTNARIELFFGFSGIIKMVQIKLFKINVVKAT